jgi:hypothetical protein
VSNRTHHFNLATKTLTAKDGAIFPAYSGQPNFQDHKFDNLHDTGPIPLGSWEIGPLLCITILSPKQQCTNCNGIGAHTHGPNIRKLTPLTGTDTYGRDAFLVHGDSILHPGAASKGCVITCPEFRIKKVDDGDILVVADVM